MGERTSGNGTIITPWSAVGLTGNTITGTSSSSFDLRHYEGAELLHFFRRRKAGELLPMLSFQDVDIKYSIDSMSYSYTRLSDGHAGYLVSGVRDDECALHDVPWQISEAEIRARALTYSYDPYVQQAAAAIYGRGFDALTFVAELHTLRTLFSDAARTLKRLLRSIRSKKLIRGWGDFTSLWLQIRYAFRPLWYDMQDINALIIGMDNGKVRIKDRKGSSRTETSTTVHNDSGTTYTGTFTLIDQWEIGIRGSVVADFDPPEITFNPFLTAWELTRFSFIIDWFIQVGGWIEAMSFLTFADKYYAAGGYSVTLSRTGYYQGNYHSGYSGSKSCATSCTAKARYRFPTTVPAIPQINVKLSPAKLFDLVSIITQVMK